TPQLDPLWCDDGLVLEGAGNDFWRSPSFTIEMETGTGKTYVYLRTIYELRKTYGFSKFIIVVPSVAIYEGVIKSFQIMQSHFRSVYNNEVVNLVPYDGAQISRVRSFATSSFAEIMVMTDAAFNKITNNLYKPSEKLPGELLPYQYIQETRPIVILDEPQSIDTTEKAKSAIRTLHPLFTLRYSATHRFSPNLVYRLTPVEAYRQNLVKKIQVVGLTELDNLNQSPLALESVAQNPFVAKVKTLVLERGTAKETTVTLKQGDNLYNKTHREEHLSGYIVEEINVTKGSEFLQFENGLRISLRGACPSRPEIFRAQIEETIKQHMKTQEALHSQGIKVLSLFFIDRVANYASETGFIRTAFDEAFNRIKRQHPLFEDLEATEVREGYFAKNRTRTGDEEAIDTSSRNQAEREAEKAAFNLIMRDKEQLLSFNGSRASVSFIFAHSALKEGWDNPNVFQICTLNQTTSDIKKRQEIGRGLRLCVNQDGERVFDEDVNVLTVVANESYETYAATLQQEYLETGEESPPKPKRPKEAHTERNDSLFNSAEFQEFWSKLCQQTSYNVQIDTEAVIEECVTLLNGAMFPEPKIILTRGRFVLTEFTVSLDSVQGNKAKVSVEVRDSDGNTEQSGRLFSIPPLYTIKARDNLAKVCKDERLRDYTVLEVIEDGDNSCIQFTNHEELTKYRQIHFCTEKGQKPDEQAVRTLSDTYPIFNLIDRTAKETTLTRPTINRIFQGMRDDKKSALFKNPEGFAGVFISTIKEAVAEHIVRRLEFTVSSNRASHEVEKLFPPQKAFPQKELIAAGEQGLYDKVQIDSGVEERFVEHRLKTDSDKVIGYFKFPPAFKVSLPKIVGNYNPDWGILRQSEDGKQVLQLVRETKSARGSRNLDQLPSPRERWKIECAEKHFKVIGIDYRPTSDEDSSWWTSKDNPVQNSLLA
ncbi:DEAD/DEAH box helicase family protein, partial [Cyanobacteria bacterium FACHB-471]|nr:DEAD/DEAH box helicase family protein [Cyanobacteria bacterium FACHB-471]